MFSTLKNLLFFILVSQSIISYSQTTCINYDTRYPITTSTGKVYKWNPVWNFSNMKQKKVSGLNIGGNGMFQGLLQYLPPSYSLAANAAKKYPVIIYFHGGASKGWGTAADLCRLFKDRGADSAGHKTLAGRVENSTSNLTQTYLGTTYEYIVISPQFTQYTRLQPGIADKFPSAQEVENVINYVVSKYRIDLSRIYLTGYSNGANMIIEYVGSSLARAKRVAAIMPVALCSQLGHPNNSSRGIYAKYIGLAKLKTWFVYCEADNCASGPVLNVSNKWVDSIMKVPGYVRPRYSRLRNLNPAFMYNCSDSLLHDAWSRAFDPNFRVSNFYTPTGAVGANDAINLNMYQWFIRQTNTTTAAASPLMLEEDVPAEVFEKSSVTISPNPFSSEISVSIYSIQSQRVNISLTDITGKLIQRVNGIYGNGNSQIKMRPLNIKNGVYILKVSGETFSSTHKVIRK